MYELWHTLICLHSIHTSGVVAAAAYETVNRTSQVSNLIIDAPEYTGGARTKRVLCGRVGESTSTEDTDVCRRIIACTSHLHVLGTKGVWVCNGWN